MSDFLKTYPERYVEVGISEQNAIDVSAGLANGALSGDIGDRPVYLHALLRAGAKRRRIQQNECEDHRIEQRTFAQHARLVPSGR
jgi:transketolase C-terminal domain/subunit